MEPKKSILDYLTLGTLEAIFDSYCTDYEGICIAINDMDENIIIARNFHTICSNFHRANPETEKLCIECNKYITTFLETNDYIEYKCKNGLVDIAFPLIVEEQRIGTFYIGQVFVEGDLTPESFFVEHAKKHNFNNPEYLKVAKSIKTLDRQKIDSLVERIKNDIVSLITL